MPLGRNGPDEVLATDNLMTWLEDGCVKLRMESSGPASEKPVSVVTAFKKTVDKNPEHKALAAKVNGQWKYYSYRKFYSLVRQAARAFIKLGLEPCHGVGILGFNSPEWFISDLASIFAGGFATGIYTTNNAEACHYVAENAKCNIIVVENDQQLQKFLQVRSRLPHLKAIVQYSGKPKADLPNVYSWDQMMALGSEDLEPELEKRIRQLAPNMCCTLIYTSGTTGNPKGVMISHDNIIWTAKMIVRALDAKFNQEIIVTYLPLSHIAGQLIDIFGPMICGGTIYFAQPDALKGSLGVTLKEARPTFFLGVPRVWEKMQEAMLAVAKSNGAVTRSVAAWAKKVGLKGNQAIMNGDSTPVFFGLANRLVFKKVRLALGLDRCKICLSGAAPIMKETLDFFFGLNIPIFEVYGMSESSGPHTVATPSTFFITSVGKEFPGAKTLLADRDADGNGEICMGGRHVFMGYLNMEDKTREAIDSNGWLHSGDIGKKDAKGFLYITGRIKELIITAGGENIPPVLIEDKVKECLPCISNCMLIGDKRKFLSMLLTLKTEVDTDTLEPKDRLIPAAVDWCKSVGSQAKTVTDVIGKQDVAVLKAIQAGIDAANKRATSRAQCIQKWSVLPRDFSVPGGELGPTLKLKRQVVTKMYAHTIDAFYADLD